MSLEDRQVHFFEKLHSELGFSRTAPSVQEILRSINSSLPTNVRYQNVSSGETLEGAFFLKKGFLVYYQAETMELPKIILDLSYARLQSFPQCTLLKISLDKNQNTYDIMFDYKTDYDAWMMKLRKVCILTDFEKKYKIEKFIVKSGNLGKHLLKIKMGDDDYSATVFDKKYIASPENLLERIRLMNEIEILRSLKHKNVLNLQEVQETEDSIYLVTDSIHNLTLRKFLKAPPSPLSVSETQTIMYQLLKVLAEMASRKIVHRNLKPSNILMEDKNNIRIINFGLATIRNSPKANARICGTPGYIAPEILTCHHKNIVYDDKVDVFSAGCIFFQMIFGYPLFQASETSETFFFNKTFKFSDLIQLVMKEQNTSKSLTMTLGFHLLLKLLHNDPKQRISAQEALNDVYFKTKESLHEDQSETKVSPQTSSSQSSPKKVSFDLSPSSSLPLRGSFSETVGHLESSTLSSSETSLRKSFDDNLGKKAARSCLKNQPRFKSAEKLRF